MLHSETDPLDTRLRGQAIHPGDPDYDSARSLWNAMIDKRPALIVRPQTLDDVVAAVVFARERDLAITVRGGGHNIAGTAIDDGALAIDLSAMRAAQVDAARRTVRVEGGATLADLDRATQAHGLATPGGVVSSTGVAGLTLGGGFGWLSRKHGLAADNLLAVELVTAEGRVLTASEDEHADLFWALRGGSGNFGVATAFTFRLHPVGPEVLFGPTVHRLEDAAAVLRHYRDFALTAPRDCCVWADLLTAPPLPFLPERYHGTKVLTLMQCWAGDPEEGAAALAPLRNFGQPIGDAVALRPYGDAQQILDQAYETGARNYWRSSNHATLPDALLDNLVALAATLPTAESDILLCQLGGAIADVAPESTAFPHRQVQFIITPGARWRDPNQDSQCLAWIRETCAPLSEGASDGAYVNFIAEREGRARDAYGGNYDRLAAVKANYDPGNAFRINQNVPPAP